MLKNGFNSVSKLAQRQQADNSSGQPVVSCETFNWTSVQTHTRTANGLKGEPVEGTHFPFPIGLIGKKPSSANEKSGAPVVFCCRQRDNF